MALNKSEEARLKQLEANKRRLERDIATFIRQIQNLEAQIRSLTSLNDANKRSLTSVENEINYLKSKQ